MAWHSVPCHQICFQRSCLHGKFLWKHSITGEYQVRTAYTLLNSEMGNLSWQNQLNPKIWSLIWKVKVPLRIINFIWRLLRDSLANFLNLRQRGLSLDTTCPLCHEEDETSTHLFLQCPFARACWHRSTLAIHASDYANISVQQWLNSVLMKHDLKIPDSMVYLQALFTFLWTMWLHYNRVVHDGITPNPLQVILMA